MSKIRGGRKRTHTVLEVRRQAWDATQGKNSAHETHRPGSNNRKKQA